jgi:hypothetical protein
MRYSGTSWVVQFRLELAISNHRKISIHTKISMHTKTFP